MKKGFTLIELLAVIVILAIILVIAVPRIMKAIDSSKVNAYISNEKLVLKSAELYVSKNIDSLPVNVGDTSEILLSSLITDGYIKDIKSPFNKNNSCSGYVLITKLENDSYDYKPHINCINNTIVGSSQDKLLLHYKFDDFQEPTVNLVTNPTVFNSGWISYSNGNDGAFSTEFNVEGLNLINRRSWAGAKKDIVLPTPGTYTLSVWIKVISRTQPTIGANLYTAGGGIGDQNVGASWNADKIGTWQKIEMTRTFTTSNITLYLICYGGVNGAGYEVSAQYTMPQIEQKSYSTTFVDGTRSGIIKDYSINNNHSNLTVATTPKWTSNSKVGAGAYQFNGSNTVISAGNKFNFNKTSDFTVSFWININDHSVKLAAAAGIIGKGHYYDNTWDIWLGNTNRIVFEMSGDPTRNGYQSVQTPVLELQKWHFYTATYSNGIMKAYLNGELIGTGTYSGTGDFNNNNDLLIGQRWGDISRTLSGSMDDVRIYNRTLSIDEIKLLYDTTK